MPRIQETYNVNQNNKPLPIIRDSRNTLIEVGKRVAYNFSGDIAIGTIKEIKRNEWK